MLLMIAKERDSLLLRTKPDLEKQGFVVDLAHDGMEGDRKVRSSDYDVVILDAKLPNVDGFALLKNWRRDGIKASVLLLTARANTEDMVLGLDLGADVCLTRPFELQELHARLRALMRRCGRRPTQVKDAILRVRDLEIDTNTRVVKRNGKAIRLNPREFSLLEFLVRNRGNVVTRSMIRTHLKIEPTTASSNVVDVHIRYLRMKIDRGSDSRLILTHWGKGYLIGA